MRTVLSIVLSSVALCAFGARDYVGATNRAFCSGCLSADPGYAMTMSAWVNPRTFNLGVYRHILLLRSGSASGGNYSGFWIYSSDIRAYDDANGAQGYATATITSNTWQHIAFTKTSSSNRVIYVSGTPIQTNTATLSNGSTRTNIVINTNSGTGSAGSYPYDGAIAEVALWNVTLSSGELSSLANGISPLRVRPANLIFYAPLYDTGATSINMVGQVLGQTNPIAAVAHPRIYR